MSNEDLLPTIWIAFETLYCTLAHFVLFSLGNSATKYSSPLHTSRIKLGFDDVFEYLPLIYWEVSSYPKGLIVSLPQRFAWPSSVSLEKKLLSHASCTLK